MSGFSDHLVEKLIKWNYLDNGMNKSNMLDKLYCEIFSCRYILHTVEKW
jgi:hypothetical protein